MIGASVIGFARIIIMFAWSLDQADLQSRKERRIKVDGWQLARAAA